MEPIDAIAAGGEPTWSETFTHSQHGKLTFTVPRTLRNSDWIRHSAALDRIVRLHGGDPDNASARTTLFANACAGIVELMVRPVVDERRIEDPEDDMHDRIERVYYDPLDDDDMDFPLLVWGTFFKWRNVLLTQVGELGKDSGETSGSASAEPSPAVTVSPSTILA